MGELAWDHARRILARRGTDPVSEEEIAQAALALLDRASNGPQESAAMPAEPKRGSRRDHKVAARTRTTSAPDRPWRPPEPPESAKDDTDEGADDELADVIPLEIFDARKEAERWW